MNRIFLALSVLATAALLASCLPGGTATPVAAPKASETPLPAATATGTPPAYPERTDPLGIAVVQDKGTLLAFYDFDGNLLGTRSLLPSGSSSDRIHVSGSASAGLETLTVIRVKSNYLEMAVLDGEQEILRLDSNLHSFTAVPGQPVIAFGTARPTENSGELVSQIYIGTPETLADARPVFDYTGPYGGALGPLRIHMEDGRMAGIWYSQRPYAIGGHILYDLTNGLYYLDLASGLSTEFTVPNDDIFQPVFSPDEAWLSYVSHGSMKFYNMQSGETFSIPQLPESDRGGGDVTIAPDNRTVAWKEAHGSTLGDPPDYYAILRVGVIGEGPSRDFTETFFEQAAGDTVNDMTPIVWLDGQTLLVSLMDENGFRQLWTLDLSGPTPRLLADGDFTGFIYP
jgi:hypothetical protein